MQADFTLPPDRKTQPFVPADAFRSSFFDVITIRTKKLQKCFRRAGENHQGRRSRQLVDGVPPNGVPRNGHERRHARNIRPSEGSLLVAIWAKLRSKRSVKCDSGPCGCDRHVAFRPDKNPHPENEASRRWHYAIQVRPRGIYVCWMWLIF